MVTYACYNVIYLLYNVLVVVTLIEILTITSLLIIFEMLTINLV